MKDKNNYLKLKEIKCKKQKIDYHTFNEPIVFRKNCIHNRAYKEWNIETLPLIFKHDELPVEIYENADYNTLHMDMDMDQYFTMKKIIKIIKNNKPPYIYCAEVSLDNYNYPNIDKYLNNFNITKRIPYSHLLYLGNKSRSGCHIHFMDDFLLNQIFGKKTVYLFDYFDNKKYISSSSIFSPNSNFIKEDFFKLDHSKMKIFKVTLNPGDSLSIPPWWWHSAEGHDISCSITSVYPRYNLLYLLNKPTLYCNIMIGNVLINFITLIENKYKIKYEDYNSIKFIIIIILLLPFIILFTILYKILKYLFLKNN